jgi:hypothetical protein
MISIKSNIKEFLQNYRKKVANFKVVLNSIAEKLATRMAHDMYDEIARTENVWAIDDKPNFHDETGKMGFHTGKGFEYWFDIQPTSESSVRVSIGEKIIPHRMEDESLVNPAYFIEFGFGVVGQRNPMKNADVYNWKYNINNHTEGGFPSSPWAYSGFDGKVHISDGAKGINFMYNTIQRYKDNWQQYLKELLKEQANG